VDGKLRAIECSTNKILKAHRWLLRRPRFHLHFTPTSSSWLYMVERCFFLVSPPIGHFIDAYLAKQPKWMRLLSVQPHLLLLT
jgi:hypothetical protein